MHEEAPFPWRILVELPDARIHAARATEAWWETACGRRARICRQKLDGTEAVTCAQCRRVLSAIEGFGFLS